MDAISNNTTITNTGSIKPKKKYNPISLAAGAVCWTVGDMALELLDEKNRADSFTKTVKNCAKSHTIGMKDLLGKGVKFFTKKENWQTKINNISNKKFFAGLVATELIANYFLVKGWKKFTS